MLTLAKPVELFFANFSSESPFLGEPSVPLTGDSLAFRVIVFFSIRKLLGVIRTGLTCTQRLGNSQHCGLLEKALLPLLGPAQLLFACLLHFLRSGSLYGTTVSCSTRSRRHFHFFSRLSAHGSFDEFQVLIRKLDIREAHRHHQIPALQVPV